MRDERKITHHVVVRFLLGLLLLLLGGSGLSSSGATGSGSGTTRGGDGTTAGWDGGEFGGTLGDNLVWLVMVYNDLHRDKGGEGEPDAASRINVENQTSRPNWGWEVRSQFPFVPYHRS